MGRMDDMRIKLGLGKQRNKAPVVEERAKPVQSKKWNCPLCTFENNASKGDCEMCTTARPRPSSQASRLSKKQQAPREEEKHAEPSRAKPAQEWSCTACTYKNSPSMGNCDMCGQIK